MNISSVKKCVYTVIFGDYDTLKEPLQPQDGWDFICFTDQPITSDIYKVIQVTDKEGLSDKMLARKYFINPDLYLPKEYDFSVLLGGQMQINCDLNEVFNVDGDADIMISKHTYHSDVYQEASAVLALNKAGNIEKLIKQLRRYARAGLPERHGMIQTGVLGRWHNRSNVKKFASLWWDEVRNNCHRDQIAYVYIRWKHEHLIEEYLYDGDFFKKYFIWHKHNNGS